MPKKTMLDSPSAGVLPAIFGPRLWHEKAARILGITFAHAFSLANGRRRLTRRQASIIEAYAKNRRQAQASELKAAIESTTKRHKAALQALIAAQAVLQAKAAERQRQGRL